MYPAILRQLSNRGRPITDENVEGNKDSSEISNTASSKAPERGHSVDENQEANDSSRSCTPSPRTLRRGRRSDVVCGNPGEEGSSRSYTPSHRTPRRGSRRSAIVRENPEGESSSWSLTSSPDSPMRQGEGSSSSWSFKVSPKSPRGLPSVSRLSSIKSPMMSLDDMTKRTKQVRDLGAKSLSKATLTTAKHVGRALQDTEEAYEKSAWCWLPRFLVQNFPRVLSFLFGVVMPLWVLIGLAAGFGILLASYEAPHEQEINNIILESRARINRTFVDRTDLAQLPTQCIVEYLNQTDRLKLEQQINDSIMYASSLENDANNITSVNEANVVNANMNYTSLGDILDQTEEEMYSFMLRCQQEQNKEVVAYLEVRDKDGDSAADSLFFNWNRCWPKEINDEWGDTTFTYFPPDYLIEASHPVQQEATVETEFIRILDESEKECLDLGGEEDECFEQGLRDASEGAGNICHDNVEGTSWFFFTIMTTLGYGNQAPVTAEGRMLIYIAGISSLILFAAVLGSAGYVITAIFDDFVSRLVFAKFLEHSFGGVVLWAGIWIGWAYAIAYGADLWWEERMPDFDFDVGDMMWFGFISTSTIGLGDYFLQPEVMFARDALTFSITFLVGFVFLSTFLNKLAEFLFNMLPKRESSLETRLKKTSLILWTDQRPCNGYLQSRLRPNVNDHEEEETRNETLEKETEYGISEKPQLDVQEQVARVEIFKSQLPNLNLPPPLNTMKNIEGEKNVLDLMDEEVMILKALLESAEQRRTELSRAGEEISPVVVRTTSLLRAVGPPPLESSEKSFSWLDSERSAFSRSGSVSSIRTISA